MESLKTVMFITLFVILDEKRKTAESGAKTLGKQAPFARAATKNPRARKPLFHLCFGLEIRPSDAQNPKTIFFKILRSDS